MYNNKTIQALEGEQRTDVKGYEGLYQVSNKARVRSLDKINVLTNTYGTTYTRKIRGKILSGYVNSANGQIRHGFTLHREGVQKFFSMHFLVATAFIHNPNKYTHIEHLDGDNLNNLPSNLRRVPYDYFNKELISKLIKKKVNQIDIKTGEVIKVWDSATDAAIQLRKQPSAIIQCCNKAKGYTKAYGYRREFCESAKNRQSKTPETNRIQYQRNKEKYIERASTRYHRIKHKFGVGDGSSSS